MRLLLDQLTAADDWSTFGQYVRVLLDQGLPRSAAGLLRGKGVDTLHTGEIGLARAEDAVILKRGVDEGRLIVTLDADFHQLLALANAKSPSVIRIRIEGLHSADLAQLIFAILQHHVRDLLTGVAMSVTDDRIRVRPLPFRQADGERSPPE